MRIHRPSLALALSCVLTATARPQAVPSGITVEPLATSLGTPTGFEFMPDGRAQLRADCNRGGARYEAGAGRTLTLSPAAMTKMGCPAGSQGGEFLRQLADVSAYAFADGNLVLTLRADAGTMVLAPLGR